MTSYNSCQWKKREKFQIAIFCSLLFLLASWYLILDRDSSWSMPQIFFIKTPPLAYHYQRRTQNFGHISKLGLPYLRRSLKWTKISQDKCFSDYLPSEFGWTFWNQTLLLDINFVRILLVNNQVKNYKRHISTKVLLRDA